MTGKSRKYICSNCNRQVGRENLAVKRAVFKEMGSNGTTLKTRTTAWLCDVPSPDGGPSCLRSDPDFERPLYSESPGIKALGSEVPNGS